MGSSSSKPQDPSPPAPQAQAEAPEQAMPSPSAPPPEVLQPTGEVTIPGWNPCTQCGDATAGERALWLTRNVGLSTEEAQKRVMQEFPALFNSGSGCEPAGWNPNAMCDGSLASSRASWLMTNKGMSQQAAQTQVMSEFPQVFAAGSSAGTLTGWRGDADCGGSSAASRAQWLQENKGLSLVEAQQQVMAEFPAMFSAAAASTVVAGPVAGWRGDADCGGSSAASRAQWLQENKGLAVEEAQRQVMAEFPASFTAGSGGSVPGVAPAAVAGPTWDPNVQCGEATAGARAEWLVNNKGMNHLEAQRQVMSEFAQQFLPVVSESEAAALWKDDVDCDGISSAIRLRWLIEKRSFTQGAAKSKLISEFAAAFSSGGVAAPAPAESSLVSLGGSAAAAVMSLSAAAPDLNTSQWKLVWSDEFNYTGPPDPTKWSYDVGGHGWGNNELQYYTEGGKNAWVSDGKLRITVKCENVEGRDYTSARLVSRGLSEWTYGKIEAKLRFPAARGSWSAFWMMPKDFSLGEWPRCGEIDIMEHVGHDRGMVHGTVHTGAFNHLKQTQVGKCFHAMIDNWHTYGVTWSPTKIEWFYDGQPYHSFEKKMDGGIEAWPFDQPFYLLFNVAVGGAWGGQKGVDECAFETSPQCMDVAWVRVYQQS